MIDLSNIKVGDKLALREKDGGWGDYHISHRILVVEHITPTKVECRSERGGVERIRFKRSTGQLIGDVRSYAELVTDKLLASIGEQRSRLARNLSAHGALSDLEGKYLYQLGLTLEQTEALAKAWIDIKAMDSRAWVKVDAAGSKS